ncbi:MAG: hypothetical protein AAF569_03065, partial [Pseudomonadota bacterium]
MNIELKQTCDIEVIDVIKHQDGKVVDLFLRKPESLEFGASDGVGIPASLSPQMLFKLKGLLKGRDGEELLLPVNGKAGPNYASPSDELLECMLSKAYAAIARNNHLCPFYDTIKLNVGYLKIVLVDESLKEILKANYSIFDLLSLFPKVLAPMDIIEFQPKEHGNKTYTVDGRIGIQRKGINCFRLNVTQDDGPAYRALFGEQQPKGIKPGQASTFLRSLKIGDTLTINVDIKPGPKIPRFKNNK